MSNELPQDPNAAELHKRLDAEREGEIARLYESVDRLAAVDFQALFARVKSENLHEDVGGSILKKGELIKTSLDDMEKAVRKIEEMLAW